MEVLCGDSSVHVRSLRSPVGPSVPQAQCVKHTQENDIHGMIQWSHFPHSDKHPALVLLVPCYTHLPFTWSWCTLSPPRVMNMISRWLPTTCKTKAVWLERDSKHQVQSCRNVREQMQDVVCHVRATHCPSVLQPLRLTRPGASLVSIN